MDRVHNVVVTGASAGVGRAVALEFARRGCNVAVLARGRERVESAAEQARRAGVRAVGICVDVADAVAVEAAASQVESELGPIDIWVNNAMATIFSPVERIQPEEFRRVTEVTYLGQVHGTLAALKRMKSRNRGTIVQVGSALSYRAIPLQSAYCAAKFAVRGFTNSLRSELLHDKSRVRLTMVQLPAVNTPQFDWARNRMGVKATPLPPIFEPEAVAREIVRAAFEAPREHWIGGPTLKAIIGNMALPGLGDEILATEAYDGQLSKEPLPPNAADNLMSAPQGDPGKRGRFAHASNSVHGFDPAWLRAGAVVAGLGVVALAVSLGRRSGQARLT